MLGDLSIVYYAVRLEEICYHRSGRDRWKQSDVMKHATRSGPDMKSVDRCHGTRTRRRRGRRRVGEDNVIVRSAAAINASACAQNPIILPPFDRLLTREDIDDDISVLEFSPKASSDLDPVVRPWKQLAAILSPIAFITKLYSITYIAQRNFQIFFLGVSGLKLPVIIISFLQNYPSYPLRAHRTNADPQIFALTAPINPYFIELQFHSILVNYIVMCLDLSTTFVVREAHQAQYVNCNSKQPENLTFLQDDFCLIGKQVSWINDKQSSVASSIDHLSRDQQTNKKYVSRLFYRTCSNALVHSLWSTS